MQADFIKIPLPLKNDEVLNFEFRLKKSGFFDVKIHIGPSPDLK